MSYRLFKNILFDIEFNGEKGNRCRVSHKIKFSPKFHDEMFLTTDIICVKQFGTGCLKKVLDNRARFVLFEVLICMVRVFLLFSVT